VTALKDAVDAFLNYLDENSTDDRVSLSIYTYSDGTAKLEHALTKSYSTVSNTVRTRQAGHYLSGTNISAGMNRGRLDLQNNARPNVAKLMVLMTDGVVNLPSGNTTNDKQAVRNEAIAAAAAKIPIVTISVGALVDTALMQEVADITGGAAFVVPGGQPISAVEDQLEAVFAQVAADRPLKLVQ
jgi:Mg-chelatase subunit ChlD